MTTTAKQTTVEVIKNKTTGYIQVFVVNASSRAWNKIPVGKNFSSIEEAINHYKSKKVKQAIMEAEVVGK